MISSKEKYTNLFLGITDIISLMICYLIASYSWFNITGKMNEYTASKIVNNLETIVISFCITFFIFNMNRYFMKRSVFEEFMNIIKYSVVLAMCMTLLLYFTKGAEGFSRGIFGITIIANLFLDTLLRCLLKKELRVYFGGKKNRVFLITTSDRAEKVIQHVNTWTNWESEIKSIAIIDQNMVGENICGIPVVAGIEDIMNYAKRDVVDEAFFHVPYNTGRSFHPYVTKLESMGITVNININVLDTFDDYNFAVKKMGDFPVVTMAITFFDSEKMLIKRMIDIVGSVIGCCLTVIVGIFVAIAIKIESPGPIIFKQKRVGQNGRYFYIYKFRSMYMDAEERKKELMNQNEMQGLMFKMEHDPRITKVGKFIRDTSIDELPQFFNVLKGDMSLVGTRPPTVDEFKQYKSYHKRRLSMKPGITGMWQVSGRSDISDFEEVVRLDLEYIDNWSIMLDFKILLRTIMVVFMKVGSR